MIQKPHDLRQRLDKAGAFQTKQEDRHILFHGKPDSLPLNSQSHKMLRAYLSRRQQVVGQILLTAEKLREKPSLVIKNIEATGAFWQYHRGTIGMPACHTSPCLLLFNGLLPHRFTDNLALQHKIIQNFADVMLMPEHINRVDSFVDDKIGSKDAMEQAMKKIIFDGAGFQPALEHYRKVRSGNLREFLSTFSPMATRYITVFDDATGIYRQEMAGVMDEDASEFRLIITEYIESDEAPPNYKELENYRLQL